MRSRIIAPTKQERDAIHRYTNEVFQKHSQAQARRLIKLLCLSLHEEFGFGAGRCSKLAQRVNDLSIERDNDPVFWTHVDKVMEQIGLDFQPEDYEEMDS